MTCASPISWEQLVDYWAGDLDDAEVDRIDEHVIGCASCSAQSDAIARMVFALRGRLPPVVSAEQVRELADGGAVIEHNPCLPGEAHDAHFRPNVQLLIHHLGGLDLAAADHVSVIVRTASSGDVLGEDHFVPFDRDRGEVLIACQRHFATMPPDVVFDVHVHRTDGAADVASFPVPHVFDG